jgi:hypothetical protein
MICNMKEMEGAKLRCGGLMLLICKGKEMEGSKLACGGSCC